MYLIKDEPHIKTLCDFASMFELYRLVDPITHDIYKLENGVPVLQNGAKCHEIWHRDSACVNCTSLRACEMGRQYIKIEYLDTSVLLISSQPVTVGDKNFSLELALDVTKSMYISDNFHSEMTEITGLISKFNDISVHDAFTGLFNNTYMYSELDYIMQRSGGKPVCFAMMDIDNFKRINDTFGHVFGDKVIKQVADILKREFSGGEIYLGRMGGDEFGVIFDGCSLEQAEQLCKNAVRSVAEGDFHTDNKSITITISYGCAAAKADSTRETLADSADKKMYENKLKIKALRK